MSDPLERMMKRKEDMKRGALKGLHKDLKNSIEQDDELVWPEIYSFLLADIAVTLRAIRRDANRREAEDMWKDREGR